VADQPKETVRVGVSACLLGQTVRYDGGHKRDTFVALMLADHVELLPVCPEVELGLGVPRETLRLERRSDGDVRMIGNRTGTDLTEEMRRYARARVRALRDLELCGYVFKKGSPSCGLERVRVRTESGTPARGDRGLFAAELTRAMPLLPVEEEGRLNDLRLRESFVERVFAYSRLRRVFVARWRRRDVVAFHAAEKLLLLAHSPQAQRDLGRLVAAAKSLSREELRDRYEKGFMDALARPAPRHRHVNVLQHALGHLKHHLEAADKRELLALIEDYRRAILPLIVPITLLRHHARRSGMDTLCGQTYLEPHPRELMLRNHV
jgi:uncharacterized protein YbgA (DUF1722 family)/uncharacterized protein YbbK (DUF523 family)